MAIFGELLAVNTSGRGCCTTPEVNPRPNSMRHAELGLPREDGVSASETLKQVQGDDLPELCNSHGHLRHVAKENVCPRILTDGQVLA